MSAVTTEATPARAPVSRRRERLRGIAERWALVGVLVVLVAGFSIAVPHTFPTSGNFQTIVNTLPPAAFIAFAAMLVLVVGEFDLSLGAILGMSQYLVLQLITQNHLAWPAAIVVALAVGLLIGSFNAFLVVGIGMNSFIATIGMATLLGGVLEWTSNESTPIFTGAPPGFTKIAQTQVAGIALPVIYALVAAVILWVAIDYTVFGREMRATGANRQAAFLSGLRTNRARVVGFVGAALLASIGGILVTARVGAADATSGPGYLLPAYAAVFLGATALRPGFFNVWGTVIAMLVVAVGITGLELLGVASWVNDVFNGAILIVAVSVSMLASRSPGGSASRLFSGRFARRQQTEASEAAEDEPPDPATVDKPVSSSPVR
jgi:ribose transport system permease protein